MSKEAMELVNSQAIEINRLKAINKELVDALLLSKCYLDKRLYEMHEIINKAVEKAGE